MKWWAGSFFWRTLAVLVIALVASQAATFWLFRQEVQRPRQAMGIGEPDSVTTSADTECPAS